MVKNRIRKLRYANGTTLQEVGDAIGLGNNTISRYETETHEPKIETWQKLADYFGVTVPYLMGIEGEQPTSTLQETDYIAIVQAAEQLGRYKLMLEIANRDKVSADNNIMVWEAKHAIARYEDILHSYHMTTVEQ